MTATVDTLICSLEEKGKKLWGSMERLLGRPSIVPLNIGNRHDIYIGANQIYSRALPIRVAS